MMRFLFFLSLFVFPLDAFDGDGRLLELSSKSSQIPPSDSLNESTSLLPGITSLTLPNGITIIARPNPDTEIVQMIFAADGGSSAFPPVIDTAAKYAGTFALQSGFEGFDLKTLNTLLFKYSIEITPRTRPFHRHLDLNFPPESLPYAFALLHHFFIDFEPKKTGMEAALTQIEDALIHRSEDCTAQFEDLYLAVNSGGHPASFPTTQEQVRSITLEAAQKAFTLSFRNPAEFSLFVVGPVDIEELTKLALRYLGTIPSQTTSPLWNRPHPLFPFPRGVIKRTLACKKEKESLVRITFPLQFPLTQENYAYFEIATQVIEHSLRDAISKKYNSTQAIDLQYHLPAYPYIDTVWVTIQFRSSPDLVESIKSLCFETLKRLASEGVKAEEIVQVRVLFSRLNDFWLKEDDYWLQSLFNHFFWKWPLRCIEESCSQQNTFSSDQINTILRKILITNDHTILTLEP